MREILSTLIISLLIIGCNDSKTNQPRTKTIDPISNESSSDPTPIRYGKTIDVEDEIIPDNMDGMLEAHNKYRTELGIDKLKWSNKIAKSAKKWALELKKRNCEMKHSPREFRSGYGENLAWNAGYKATPSGVVDLWGSEKKDFNYKTKKCNGSWSPCGHYTQIIWADTRKVGCAMVECGDEQIWVCQYFPAGNMNITRGATPY